MKIPMGFIALNPKTLKPFPGASYSAGAKVYASLNMATSALLHRTSRAPWDFVEAYFELDVDNYPNWPALFTWEPTADKYIYKCNETGKFHFVDETERFDPAQYDAFEDALVGINGYVKYHLNGKHAKKLLPNGKKIRLKNALNTTP